MDNPEFLSSENLEKQVYFLSRRVGALLGLVNDQLYSMIHFCLTLPFGGHELAEQMLRDMAKVHVKTSLKSETFFQAHKYPSKDLSPQDALKFLIDIHIKEKIMDKNWFRMEENGPTAFTVYYNTKNCSYLSHCKELVCDGFQCICTRRFFYEALIKTLSGKNYSSSLNATNLESEFCSFIMTEVEKDLDNSDRVHVKFAKTIEENITLQKAVHARTAQLEEQNENLRELKDKAELSVKMKSEFISNITHEILTPLTGMIGFAKLIGAGVGDLASIEELSKRIASQGESLLYILEEILELSKIESGNYTLNIMPTTIQALVAEAISAIGQKVKEKKQTVTEKHTPPVIQIAVDFNRMAICITNLLDNAVKFTPNGGRISIESMVADGIARIAIKDNGIGIRETDKNLIFNQFHQADGSSTRAEGGVGIGLNLANKIAALHNGELTFESEVGKGTEFVINIPVLT